MSTQDKRATVWSQANCQYCDMAIKLLTSRGYEVNINKIGSNVTKEDFMNAVPGARSVPQIFLNGFWLPRGYPQLKEMLG